MMTSRARIDHAAWNGQALASMLVDEGEDAETAAILGLVLRVSGSLCVGS
jgi:hypothetical protein